MTQQLYWYLPARLCQQFSVPFLLHRSQQHHLFSPTVPNSLNVTTVLWTTSVQYWEIPHVHAVTANQILRISTKMRSHLQKWKRACGRPLTTWVHQICRDTTQVSVTERRTDCSGGRSQRREASTERFELRWCMLHLMTSYSSGIMDLWMKASLLVHQYS